MDGDELLRSAENRVDDDDRVNRDGFAAMAILALTVTFIVVVLFFILS